MTENRNDTYTLQDSLAKKIDLLGPYVVQPGYYSPEHIQALGTEDRYEGLMGKKECSAGLASTLSALAKVWYKYIDKKSTVLEIGAGAAPFADIVRHLARTYIPIEKTTYGLSKRKPDVLLKKSGIIFGKSKFVKGITADAQSLPVASETVSVILAHCMVDALLPYELRRTIQEAKRVLTPSGVVIITNDLIPAMTWTNPPESFLDAYKKELKTQGIKLEDDVEVETFTSKSPNGDQMHGQFDKRDKAVILGVNSLLSDLLSFTIESFKSLDFTLPEMNYDQLSSAATTFAWNNNPQIRKFIYSIASDNRYLHKLDKGKYHVNFSIRNIFEILQHINDSLEKQDGIGINPAVIQPDIDLRAILLFMDNEISHILNSVFIRKSFEEQGFITVQNEWKSGPPLGSQDQKEDSESFVMATGVSIPIYRKPGSPAFVQSRIRASVFKKV